MLWISFDHKVDNVHDLHKSLQICNLAKFTKEEIDNLGNTVRIEKEEIISNIPTEKVLGSDVFPSDSTKHSYISSLHAFPENRINHNLLQISSTLVTLVPKASRHRTWKLQEHRYENIQKILVTQIWQCMEIIIYHDQEGFFSQHMRLTNIWKFLNVFINSIR